MSDTTVMTIGHLDFETKPVPCEFGDGTGGGTCGEPAVGVFHLHEHEKTLHINRLGALGKSTAMCQECIDFVRWFHDKHFRRTCSCGLLIDSNWVWQPAGSES